MFKFQGKTALVTGAAKRLGRAVVLALARSGCNVVIHYNRSAADAENTAEVARRENVGVQTLSSDLSDPDGIDGLFDSALTLTGKIDFLVNSASIFPRDELFDLTFESIENNLRINTLAPFVLTRKMAGITDSGAVVNFLDTRILDYDKHHVSYHLSKQMLFSLTRMLSAELAPGIRVNAVAPGLILPPPGENESFLERMKGTNLLNTYGSIEQIAVTTLFLLWNTFITGQVIYVDGGRHIKGRFYGS